MHPHAPLCVCPPLSRCAGQILKKLLESIKDLVNEANFDCSSAGMSLQGTINTHMEQMHCER